MKIAAEVTYVNMDASLSHGKAEDRASVRDSLAYHRHPLST
jgi:hypothetical protein